MFDYFLFILNFVLWAYGERDVTILLFIPLFGLPYLILANFFPGVFDTFLKKLVLMFSLIFFCIAVQLKIKNKQIKKRRY